MSVRHAYMHCCSSFPVPEPWDHDALSTVDDAILPSWIILCSYSNAIAL